MSMRLQNVLSRHLLKTGEEGLAELSRTFDRSSKTIERWAREGVSNPRKAYKLALACGCTEEDALRMAEECTQERARETA